MTDFKLYGVGDVPDEEPLPVVCGLDNVESLKIGASIHKSIRRHISEPDALKNLGSGLAETKRN